MCFQWAGCHLQWIMSQHAYIIKYVKVINKSADLPVGEWNNVDNDYWRIINICWGQILWIAEIL